MVISKYRPFPQNIDSLGITANFAHQNRSLSEAYFLFSLESWFSAAPKASAQPQNSGVISPFAFTTPLTVVSIVPRVHHGEDHNACKVDVIVAYDIRIDLMWVNKDNACFTKLKL